MTYYEFAIDVVQRAGELLRDATQHVVASHKGTDTRDVVTNTDLAVNAFLVSEIRHAFPDHAIYSEEGAGAGASSEYEWTIDPIDGSSNFSRGIPHFAVCVGLLQHGTLIVGAVYNPVTRELFSFEEGRGAFLNGTPIHVSHVTQPSDALGLVSIGHQAPLFNWGEAVFRSAMEEMQKVKAFGCSALDLCFLAAGRADIVLYGTLTTRDVACAVGIVRAAGGEVYTLDGAPAPLSSSRQTIVATATPELYAALEPLLHRDLLPR